jgi:SAM-dependent methyltransferase
VADDLKDVSPSATDIRYFEAAYPYNPSRQVVWDEIARYLSPWIAQSATTIDLAAGYCHFINAVDCARRVAVDHAPEYVRYAKAGVEAHVLRVQDVARHFGPEFDVALASNFLEHLEPNEVPSCLEQIFRILKTEGRLILIQPNFRYCYRRYFDDYTHRAVFDHESITQVLRHSGFEPRVVQPRFLPYTARNVASWLVSRHVVRLYLHSPFKPFAGQMLVIAEKR